MDVELEECLVYFGQIRFLLLELSLQIWKVYQSLIDLIGLYVDECEFRHI